MKEIIDIDGLPISPVLTKFHDSLRRIEELYNLSELSEEGVQVAQLLESKTEMQVLDFIEFRNCDMSIEMREIEHLILEGQQNVRMDEEEFEEWL